MLAALLMNLSRCSIIPRYAIQFRVLIFAQKTQDLDSMRTEGIIPTLVDFCLSPEPVVENETSYAK